MKAIVLTYDKYHPFTDHMIRSYDEVWPDHPFKFRVPYQQYPDQLNKRHGNKIELIQTNSSIKSTVLSLIEDLDDEEWIYWCIDDKYPINIDNKTVRRIYEWLLSIENPDISGIMFCVKSNMLKPKRINKYDNLQIPEIDIKMFRRSNYEYIWMHQFLRVKVLNKIFERLPDKIPQAKSMDAMLKKLTLPESHKIFTLSKSIALFGESTHRGMMTINSAKSFKKLNIEIPDNFQVIDKEMIMGSKEYDEYKILWHLRNIKDKIIGS